MPNSNCAVTNTIGISVKTPKADATIAGNNVQRAIVRRPTRSAQRPTKKAPNTVPKIKLPAKSDTSQADAESAVSSLKMTNPAATVR